MLGHFHSKKDRNSFTDTSSGAAPASSSGAAVLRCPARAACASSFGGAARMIIKAAVQRLTCGVALRRIVLLHPGVSKTPGCRFYKITVQTPPLRGFGTFARVNCFEYRFTVYIQDLPTPDCSRYPAEAKLSIFRASSKSYALMPPKSWVERSTTTLLYTLNHSGWWFMASAASATFVMKPNASTKEPN